MAEFTETVTKIVNCPICASDKVTKSGQQRGQQRYLCKSCNKRFRANGKGMGQRIPAEQKGMAIRMFYSGMSYKQIAESMADAFNIPEPSKRAIYEWVKDYTDRAIEEMANHRATTDGEWVADEMQLTVGGEKYWNWNVMDADTRYILASHLSKERDGRAATAVMRKAAKAAAKPPRVVKTDKLRSYNQAIEKTFPFAFHVKSEGLHDSLNNNKSERLQGTFRQRTKTLRGLDSHESGQRYLDGWVINYNLFRGHEALDDKTPAEAAKVNPPFREWADVVRDAEAVHKVTSLEKEESPKAMLPAH